MSRLGVVRWLPNLEYSGNGSANTTNSLAMFSPTAKEEWIQADVIISACVIAVLLIHAHFCQLSKVGVTTLLALLSLAVSLLIAPLVGSILLVFAIYRQVVITVLRATVGHHFSGLLFGTDAFWALEDDTSLSVINILALADFSFIVSASTQDDEPLQTISELIQDRLLTSPVPFPKLMWYRKQSCLGYFYWESQSSINIADHIRWMDIEDQGDRTITEQSLKNFVSSVTNSNLPANHAAGWEILVGRYPIKPSSDLLDAMENGGWITKSCAGVRYPVLFRVHHSIGDGIALVNLLLDSLGDPCTRCNTPIQQFRCTSPTFDRNFVRPKTPTIYEEPEDRPIISSWQESDIPKSSSCEFKSICVDIPAEPSALLKRSTTFDFSECSSMNYSRDNKMHGLRSSVRTACKRVLSFIDETKEFKTKLSQTEMKDFNIVVNDRPSGEFLDLINSATMLEDPYTQVEENENRIIQFLLKKCTAGLCMFVNVICKFVKSLGALIRQWSVLLFIPASLLNQALTQTQDSNLLHGPKLSGHKVVAWYFEQQDNSDQLLMSMIKRIRAKTGVRFSDVLLTAVSASLEKFYAQSNEVPQFITVVIPARLTPPPSTQALTKVIKTKNFSTKVTKITENTESSLENKFSVALLPLPIANNSSNQLKLFTKLRQVRKHCDLLRNSPDYLVNYWLLRVVATLLPTWLLRPMMQSTHSTLVLSNLPGPTRLTKLAGHTLHDLVFWVPNRTTTGVGVTVLSYAGRLQLGLMADRALIACQQDTQLILDGVATAIQQMDQLSSPQDTTHVPPAQ
ncbi:uncharacterized protein LOC124354164 [Homalodisca vitripennis]|uniref:uncharacterized protein LOC124354164 n=1 Tax=Homalodisca vitripennis TaxID=197043 RepID=UPI001EEBBB13|nr:uncharacterized protein LOC124354164 [Homalodisca vitripennis]KAG8254570.1 hypothetical protein J6590_005120 [Homalodisca vitripennis]